MRVSDCIAAIERVAEPSWQAPWDKSGLQVASTRREVTRMAVCLDPLPAAIGEALNLGADFILSHHPLSLKPALPNELDNWHEALRLLLCADVPLYAAHTSLDVNMAGPAGWLGRELRLANAEVLEACGAGHGFGQVGDLPESMPVGKFFQEILRLLKLTYAQGCGATPPEQISRVAICGGSGGSLMEYAAGVDIFITGDIKHHAALDAQGLGIAVLDVGHQSLEEEMMRRFAADLRQELDTPVDFLPAPSPFRLILPR